ncbi:MAG: hypothetical protein POELPBGB_00098 [Bacteroidia bacterium]|nr:hypothetical protein [Bacteroidia bacterium]
MRLSKYLLSVVLIFLAQSCEVTSQSNGTYQTLKSNIVLKQQQLREQYQGAAQSRKDSLLKAARTFLLQKITEDIFNEWYNTPWDFNGTTQVPREGTIACGYFVTTVLRDAGFNIPRVKWAQLASEGVILKVCSDIKRFRNVPVEDVEGYILSKEDGLYIIGLDCHVGFIMKKGKDVSFVHSNYYQRTVGVMKEPLKGRNPLNDSKYRVIGKILDDEMVRNWIGGVRVE